MKKEAPRLYLSMWGCPVFRKSGKGVSIRVKETGLPPPFAIILEMRYTGDY
jgi:hypothetical protein